MKINVLLGHKIITDCLANGLTLEVNKDEILIDGFYKSGNVRIWDYNDRGLVVESRYNQSDLIKDFKDLVQLNFDWWQRSKNRYAGWTIPSEPWLSILEKFGYIKLERQLREIITIKGDE